MIYSVVLASMGLILGGPLAAVMAGLMPLLSSRMPRRGRKPPPTRMILLLMLVELRSGLSVLGALRSVSDQLEHHGDLARVSRLATVAGLTASIEIAGSELRPVVAQLARAQRTGASLSSVVQRILERELAAERERRLAKAKTLPIRLMVPVTLLMLPGLILMLYAPSLLALYRNLTGAFP